MTVIEHLESFCGPIEEGWSTDPDGEKMPFQVVRLTRSPIAGAVAFSTLGLSNYLLRSPVSAKTIRQELVMLARSLVIPKNLPTVLQQVAAEAVATECAYLCGQVIGPRGILFSDSELTALYVSAPVYFPEAFSGVSTQKIGRVIFAWLIPITAGEAHYVAAHGWSKFEDILVRENPDLLDLHRHSVIG